MSNDIEPNLEPSAKLGSPFAQTDSREFIDARQARIERVIIFSIVVVPAMLWILRAGLSLSVNWQSQTGTSLGLTHAVTQTAAWVSTSLIFPGLFVMGSVWLTLRSPLFNRAYILACLIVMGLLLLGSVDAFSMFALVGFSTVLIPFAMWQSLILISSLAALLFFRQLTAYRMIRGNESVSCLPKRLSLASLFGYTAFFAVWFAALKACFELLPNNPMGASATLAVVFVHMLSQVLAGSGLIMLWIKLQGKTWYFRVALVGLLHLSITVLTALCFSWVAMRSAGGGTRGNVMILLASQIIGNLLGSLATTVSMALGFWLLGKLRFRIEQTSLQTRIETS